ncbi:hypothetical protein OG474_29960 [Kribbella sp. NBC_01505]|uniref:hypothetical protein n=1 Tax=Kribbella sp. NBC_01505 TaxID=2903580 RepID=UPI0038641529
MTITIESPQTPTIFAQPSTAGRIQQRTAGGDNEVPRDDKERPRIRIECPKCVGSGRLPSQKRPGNTVQCPTCKGKGEAERSFTRTTTYIDVLEDKSNLQAWGERKVLIGAALDPRFLDGVLDRNDEENEGRDWLNARAKAAKTKAGSEVKAERGTYLHSLSELKDQGQFLPDDVSFEDVLDMDAYTRTYRNFKHVHMEKLVVVDELKVAGTPDRVSRWDSRAYCFEPYCEFCDGLREPTHYVPLITPDGQEISEDDLLITDLKTGRVDYGQLKIAMQLAIYSRGKFYSHKPELLADCRQDMGNVRQDWGIIINLPAGSGEAELYWADLTMGWEAVQVATKIRDLRNRGKKALIPMAKTALATELALAVAV